MAAIATSTIGMPENSVPYVEGENGSKRALFKLFFLFVVAELNLKNKTRCSVKY